MRPYPVIAFVAALALSACGQPSNTEPVAEPPPETAASAPQQGPPAPQAPDLTPASAEDLEALGEGIASGQVRAGGECDPSRRGQVNLQVAGQQGDGFRVILMCGSTEVARCRGHLSADPTTATCGDGPNPQPAGPRRCILGPQNGNSAAAAASFACPEV
jgi:hypothetical protein